MNIQTLSLRDINQIKELMPIADEAAQYQRILQDHYKNSFSDNESEILVVQQFDFNNNPYVVGFLTSKGTWRYYNTFIGDTEFLLNVFSEDEIFQLLRDDYLSRTNKASHTNAIIIASDFRYWIEKIKDKSRDKET